MDIRAWPLIVYTAPATVNDEEMRAVMEASHAVFVSGARFAFVLDVSQLRGITPAQRRMITEGMARHEDEGREFCAGFAMVFSSMIVRGVLTAIHWVRKPPYPQVVFGARDEARAWAEAQLSDAG
jgi:hypothetical protein